MGKINYATGIAILQFIVYPFIFAASIFVWKRSGWRVGSKIWRYPAVLSLLRIAGSISTFIAMDHNSQQVQIAIAVCQLIGIAPLVLTYVGILRQIDYEQKIPPRRLAIVTLVAIIGLILAIAGVSTAKTSPGETYKPGTIVKVAMGIFLVVFAITMLLSAWLFYALSFSLLRYQKKLFLAIALSAPFVVVRMIYSALSDYTTIEKFAFDANETVYLCMCVLEEIVANTIVLGLGISAVLQPDFVKLDPAQMKERDQQHPDEGKPLSAQDYNTAYNGANMAYDPAYHGSQSTAYNDPTYPGVQQTTAHNPIYNRAPAPAYHGAQNV
ncbi:hypothetical protein N7481_011152 [Penicillium waksmanii]|uniref:uncharacterized protein n=1 Tax=Penicillium waksmanii TaxID=69791 RepID=UPI00254968A6|nr:uncharacterized protein N7481_011152 [Penicillium waksmanii]KAJ5973942.1 hypothetical protein N7481_011152 [Penicillium waksmanii]